MDQSKRHIIEQKPKRAQLLQLLGKLMHPKANGLTEESYDDVLFKFCAGCPDPVKAAWLIIECLDPMTDEERVDRALAMPVRLISDVPDSELPARHPLRSLSL